MKRPWTGAGGRMEVRASSRCRAANFQSFASCSQDRRAIHADILPRLHDFQRACRAKRSMSDTELSDAGIVAGCEIGAANRAAGAAYNDHTRWPFW